MSITCPKCGPVDETDGITGIEISHAYDGISFWHHAACKTLWSRWTDEVMQDMEVASPADLTPANWNTLNESAKDQRQEYLRYGG